ncbi:stalk domain-containing protein [Paenibacillus sp. PL2-23]|uniref:stalk domain-containing protein n=1 Tax=Paenibacillus sp. PL2-23 TaxID=2100729 RepID=UPI0030FAAC69
MPMKKTVMVSMLAAAISAAAVTPVLAQTTSQQAMTFEIATFYVNANPVDIRTIMAGGQTLASVRDLVDAMGAKLHITSSKAILVYANDHFLELQAGSSTIYVDGEEQMLATPVTQVAYTNFIDPAAFAEALGAKYEDNHISTIEMLDGVEQAVWVNGSQLLASNSVGEGREDYLVDAMTGAYELLLASEGASGLVLSPDGSKAAYSDADGIVYTIDLATKKQMKISDDATIKNELTWAKDGSALFFLQGDKSSVIAKLSLADGTVTKVLDDKVDYKMDLQVSADGKQFTYYVVKQPKVTADSSKEVELDDVAIDATGTEPQIYYYDGSFANTKPVQLTKDATDKAFLAFAADGSQVSYINMTADEESVGQLLTVDNKGMKASKPVFTKKDVYQLTQSGGMLYVLTAYGPTTNGIYEINPATGASQFISFVSDSAMELVISDESHVAAIVDGQLQVSVQGKWKNITN